MERISQLIFLLLFNCISIVQAQLTLGRSPRSVSLGSVVSVLNDISVSGQSPCAILSTNNLEVAIQYENLIGLNELQQNGLHIAKPISKGKVGLYLQSFGISTYQTITTGLNYAIQLNEFFSVGVGMGLKSTSIVHYENRNNFQFSVAMKGKINNELHYGVILNSIGNESKSQLGVNPTLLFLGVNYKPSTSVSLTTEFDKSLITPLRMKFACEYFFMQSLILRSGVITSPLQLSGGVGVVAKKQIRFDVGSTWQPVLGIDLHGGIIFSFKVKKWDE